MAWKIARNVLCHECERLFLSKNPKPGKDGKLRCLKCRRNLDKQKFQQKHGMTAWQKYGKDNDDYRQQQRVRGLLRNYGITQVEFDKLLDEQSGACAVCDMVPQDGELVVDHDHDSGVVRGLLCHNCNRALGLLKDDEVTIKKAISYVTAGKELNDHFAYLRLAYETAQQFSTDPSTQNGALLVLHGGHLLAADANRLPSGILQTTDRFERPAKYRFIEHAERNVLYKAARLGIKTEGLIMYCPWFACADCARAIIQCGIKEVVGHALPLHESREDWKETVRQGDIMLLEAGVRIRRIPGKVGGVKIRFDGAIVEP